MENESLIVSDEETGIRLDAFLVRRFPNYSRTYFQSLIQKKLVLINTEFPKKATKLESGDEIEIEFTASPEIALKPENIPLDILYEDPYLLAVNKPAGMVVHPAVGNWSGTFVNALIYHCKHLPRSTSLRPGIVHRLDKETSGLLLAAKDEKTQRGLVEVFALRKIEKEYLAICVGNPGNKEISKRIGRHPTKRKEMAVLEESGKEAQTSIETLAFKDPLSLVRLSPKTGRTHQLRVHLKFLGCPILGDSLYGNAKINHKYHVQRQMLHAFCLRFIHPQTKEVIELKAPLPHDMIKILQLISNSCDF